MDEMDEKEFHAFIDAVSNHKVWHEEVRAFIEKYYSDDNVFVAEEQTDNLAYLFDSLNLWEAAKSYFTHTTNR